MNFDIPHMLYHRLASFIPGLSAGQLESNVLRSVYITTGYIDRRMFSIMRKPIYDYCRGDIESKLRALPTLPTPSDPTLRKAQTLVRLGYPMIHLVNAFKLVAEGHWTIIRQENLHGAGAAQHKEHGRYGVKMHSSKTGLQFMLPLVRAHKVVSGSSNAERRLARLKLLAPEKSGALAQYRKHALTQCLGRADDDGGGAKKFVASQRVVKSAPVEFRRMPADLKRKFETESRVESRKKRVEIDSAIVELEECVAVERKRAAAAESAAPHCRAAVVGWSEFELQRLTDMMYSDVFTEARVDAAREVDLYSPSIPPLSVRRAMLDCDDGLADDVPTVCPDWVRTVCIQRRLFSNVALVFGDPPEAATFVLAYASQNPFWATFIGLRYEDPDSADINEDGRSTALARRNHEYVMNVHTDHIVYEDDAALLLAPTFVVCDVVFEGGFKVWSEAQPVPFATFVAGLPPPPKVGPKNRRRLVSRMIHWRPSTHGSTGLLASKPRMLQRKSRRWISRPLKLQTTRKSRRCLRPLRRRERTWLPRTRRATTSPSSPEAAHPRWRHTVWPSTPTAQPRRTARRLNGSSCFSVQGFAQLLLASSAMARTAACCYVKFGAA